MRYDNFSDSISNLPKLPFKWQNVNFELLGMSIDNDTSIVDNSELVAAQQHAQMMWLAVTVIFS